MKRSILRFILPLLLAATLVYGVVHLFALRFSEGDVYPAYSTLRADPLGAKAFYDALDGIPRLRVRRNYRSLTELRVSPPASLLFIGCSRDDVWSSDELTRVETFMTNGGRVILTLAPVAPAASAPSRREESKGTADDEDRRATRAVTFNSLQERWGFQASRQSMPSVNHEPSIAMSAAPLETLEVEVPYRSALRFSEPESEWRAIYRVEGAPVIMERAWGQGTLVIAGDSFFLSNEALQMQRRPGVLAWLIGSGREVVFDEKHHGIHEKSGIVSLMRKYGLQSAVGSVVLVAVLWIWMQSVPLVPVHARGAEHTEDTIIGRDSAEGMVDLLRRFIPPGKILEVCIEEWRKTYVHQPEAIARLHQSLEEIPPALRKRDPVQAYRALAAMLATKRPSRFP